MEPGVLNHGQKKDRLGNRAPSKFAEKFPLTSGDLVFLHDMWLVWFLAFFYSSKVRFTPSKKYGAHVRVSRAMSI